MLFGLWGVYICLPGKCYKRCTRRYGHCRNDSWYTPGRKRIDVDECIECGACESECPYEAIYIPGSGSEGTVPPPASGGGGGAINQSDIVNNTDDPCIKKPSALY